MAKSGHQTKIKMANGEVHAEENIFQDNSLLPQSEELARLKDVDPTIIDWLKARTEKEQDARIDFNTKRMDEYRRMGKRDHRLNLTSLYMAFVIILGGMAFSYFMIQNSLVTEGTIFAGAILVTAAVAFIPKRKKDTDKQNQ